MADLQRAAYHLTSTEEDDMTPLPQSHQRVVYCLWMTGFWVLVVITILETLILWHKYQDLNVATRTASLITNTLLTNGMLSSSEKGWEGL